MSKRSNEVKLTFNWFMMKQKCSKKYGIKKAYVNESAALDASYFSRCVTMKVAVPAFERWCSSVGVRVLVFRNIRGI